MEPGRAPGGGCGAGEGRPYHFIGIGGYGMSALARILAEQGRRVSGCDARPSERTERLRARGVPVLLGHDPGHLAGSPVVVYSTDVPADNPELLAARERGLEVRHRSEVLAGFLDGGRGVAVSGSHGKTTVTAMTALVLLEAGLDPTVILGGEVSFLDGNARLGGPIVVAEADESDGSFLRYHPEVAVVTNVEPEHLDRYGGDFERLADAFRRFLGNVRPGGLVVLCRDDPVARRLGDGLGCPVVWYGIQEEAALTARQVARGQAGTHCLVQREGRPLGRLTLRVPGAHNVSNALAALAVAFHFGVPFQRAAESLARYAGARRRFQVVGESGGVTVVDDYAHHPTEIRATLSAARERAPGRVVAVFQPQRYTRTKLLLREFGLAFAQADEVVLTEIYSPPGEQPIPGVSAQALAALIRENVGRDVPWFPDLDGVLAYLVEIARPGDIILTMGAGDIWKVAHRLVKRLERASQAC